MGPKTFGRGGHRGRGGYKSSRRATLENGKTDSRPRPSSVPGSATKHEHKEVDYSTQTNATSPEHYRDRGKPELQVLPVLKYPDGSMTTAPDMDGKTVPVTRFDNMQILRGERQLSDSGSGPEFPCCKIQLPGSSSEHPHCPEFSCRDTRIACSEPRFPRRETQLAGSDPRWSHSAELQLDPYLAEPYHS
jgi:hypothetical protein